MTTRKFPEPLASISTSLHIVGILKEGRPVESRLEHFHRCFLRSEMTTTDIFMEVAENPILFSFKHTSPDDFVCTVFEQKWFFPIIGMNLCEELPFNWNFPCF